MIMRFQRLLVVGLFFVLCANAHAAYTSGAVTNLYHTTYSSSTSTTGSLELLVDQDKALRIMEVRVHLNAVGTTQTLTVSVDSELGSAFDVVLVSQSMVSATDYVFRPDGECILGRDDELKVAWANAGNKTCGAVVVWRRVE